MTKGKLFLIPVPLGEDSWHTIPEYVKNVLAELDIFVAERAKTARHFLKTVKHPRPIAELSISELNDQTPDGEKPALLKPALEGKNIGLMSEAGCPGIADPGAELVKLAHQQGVEVVPLVGPSSILLALMASGMNGQSFCFHGYLSAKKPQLSADLKRLEQLSARQRQTQIFMETPYRNAAILETAFNILAPETAFCVAADLTLPTQFIATQKIKHWKQSSLPDLHKRPAVFLLLA